MRFNLRDRVALRNDPSWTGTITLIQDDRCKVVQRPGVSKFVSLSDIYPVGMVSEEPGQDLLAGRLATPAQFYAYLTALRTRTPLSDHVYSFRTGKIDYYPHQYRPVIRMLRSDQRRLLIADEVGLGKTIEAGLIHRELAARGEVSSVLVVCPASLRIKWRDEMQARFGARFQLWTGKQLQAHIAEIQQHAHGEPPLAIVSLQSARRKEVTKALRQLSATGAQAFDLVIFDESHHLRNDRSNNYRFAAALCAVAGHVVMLSATPINLGDKDLYNQLHLLAPNTFTDLAGLASINAPGALLRTAARAIAHGENALAVRRQIMKFFDRSPSLTSHPLHAFVKDGLCTDRKLPPEEGARVLAWLKELEPLSSIVSRTRKREVRVDTIREVHDHVVELSREEVECLNAIEAHADELRREEPPRIFRAVQLQQMACSCLPVTVDRLLESDEEADEALADELAAIREAQEDNDLEAEWAATATQTSVAPFVPTVRKPMQDSKLAALRKVLQEVRQVGFSRAILFTSYRRTLDYLHNNLMREVKCIQIDGDVPMQARQELVEQFRSAAGTELTLLMMTEVGTEGLDFQFCSCVINYDLPWNPMRIEQRIGRVDRLGQQSKIIHVFNLYTGGTLEHEVFGRLWQRIGVFARSIGPLESIISEQWSSLSKLRVQADFTPQMARDWAHRVELALEGRRQEDVYLKQNEDQLLTFDVEEAATVNQVEAKRRFVGPDELDVLLAEGLAAHFPNTHFASVRPNGNAKLKPDASLLQAVTAAPCPAGQAHIINIQRRWCLDGGPVKLVQYAESHDAAVQQIAPNHIVVQVLADAITKAPNRWWSTSIQVTASPELPTGDYVIALMLGRIVAKVPEESAAKSLEAYLRVGILRLGGDDEVRLINDFFLLAKEARQGARDLRVDEVVLDTVAHRTDRLLAQELEPRCAVRRARATARLQAASQQHEISIHARQVLIDRMEAASKMRGADLHKHQLATARQAFQRVQQKLDWETQVHIESELLGTGFLQVV
jgi:ATP-dependent helicase HepA